MVYDEIYTQAKALNAQPEWLAVKTLTSKKDIQAFYAEYVAHLRTNSHYADVRADPIARVNKNLEWQLADRGDSATMARWHAALPQLNLQQAEQAGHIAHSSLVLAVNTHWRGKGRSGRE